MAGYTLTDCVPPSGPVGVASNNYTVTLTDTIAGTVVVTPHTSGTGFFTPASVSVTNASPNATFTYTPGAVQAATITTTNDRGLSDPTDGPTYTSYAATRSSPLPVLIAARRKRARIFGIPPGTGTPFSRLPLPVIQASRITPRYVRSQVLKAPSKSPSNPPRPLPVMVDIAPRARGGRAVILPIPPRHNVPVAPLVARGRPIPRGRVIFLPRPPRHNVPMLPIISRGRVTPRGRAVVLPKPPKQVIVPISPFPISIKIARGPQYKFPGVGKVIRPVSLFAMPIGMHSVLAAIVNEDGLYAEVVQGLAAIVDDGPHALTTGSTNVGPGGPGTGAGGGSGGGGTQMPPGADPQMPDDQTHNCPPGSYWDEARQSCIGIVPPVGSS